jgi:hypothetical protein
VGTAFAWLTGAGITAFACFGALLIWHLVRRGRLIRDGLAPPKRIELPDPADPRGRPQV